jgi:hypothetical protein
MCSHDAAMMLCGFGITRVGPGGLLAQVALQLVLAVLMLHKRPSPRCAVDVWCIAVDGCCCCCFWRRLLLRSQVDNESSIRANTTVLLGNIAQYLGDVYCKKVGSTSCQVMGTGSQSPLQQVRVF